MTQLLWLMRIDFTKLHVRKMFLDHLSYREYRVRRSEDGRKQNMLLKSIEHPERLWTTFLRIYGHITARCVTQDLLFASSGSDTVCFTKAFYMDQSIFQINVAL